MVESIEKMYVIYDYLRSFCTLNYTGFVKINKKVTKRARNLGIDSYLADMLEWIDNKEFLGKFKRNKYVNNTVEEMQEKLISIYAKLCYEENGIKSRKYLERLVRSEHLSNI